MLTSAQQIFHPYLKGIPGDPSRLCDMELEPDLIHLRLHFRHHVRHLPYVFVQTLDGICICFDRIMLVSEVTSNDLEMS